MIKTAGGGADVDFNGGENKISFASGECNPNNECERTSATNDYDYVKHSGKEYKYMTYAGWTHRERDISGNNKALRYVMGVSGSQTAAMPGSGRATYQGGFSMLAAKDGDNINDTMTFAGDMSLDADFGKREFTATFADNDNSSDGTTATMVAQGTITGSELSANNVTGVFIRRGVTMDVDSGSVKGGFFGPKAAEVGGVMTAETNSGHKATGVFAGEKR